MGVFPPTEEDKETTPSSPHVRGGVSGHKCRNLYLFLVLPTYVGVFLVLFLIRRAGWQFSPHTWGCFFCQQPLSQQQSVLPTYVGVFLRHWPISWVRISSPHIRGGVSQPRLLLLSLLQFSPHTWGCFYSTEFKRDLARVLPTYVGVFLVSEEGSIELKRFSPHTWGCFPSSVTAMFSPRAWGCLIPKPIT